MSLPACLSVGVDRRVLVVVCGGQGNTCFLVLRQGPYSTVQACYFKDKANPEASKAVLKFLGSLSTESVVDMQVGRTSSSFPCCC